MIITAIPSTARAIVSVDAENVIRRNFVRDPRISTDDQAGWGITSVGYADVSVTNSAEMAVDLWRLRIGSLAAGDGARLELLPSPEVVPGVTVHGWVEVAQSPDAMAWTGQWQARLVSSGSGASSSPALRNGAGSVQFSGVVGANRDPAVEIVANEPGAFHVVGVYAGMVARASTFSGHDPATSSASYRWTGEQARSISEEILTTPETMSVFRSVAGVLTPIRGLQNVPAVGATISDNEIPLGTMVTYVVVLSNGLRYYSNPVMVQTSPASFGDQSSWPILSDPITGESVRVIIRDWPEKTIKNEGQRIRVRGRRAPIIVSDIEGTPESSPVLETATLEDAARLDALLSHGEPVLLRAPCPGIDDAYLHVDSRTVARVQEHKPTHPGRVHTLSAVEVDPPDMHVRGRGDTLGDLDAVTGTMGAVASRWATLGDVAAADLIGGGS